MPRTTITVKKDELVLVPVVSISKTDVYKVGEVYARAFPCVEDKNQQPIYRLIKENCPATLPREDVVVGPLDGQHKRQLYKLLDEYRDCFALNTGELGCAKAAEMEI